MIPRLQPAPLKYEDPEDSVTESETESDRERARVQFDGRRRVRRRVTEAQTLRAVTNTNGSATESDTSVGNLRAGGSRPVSSSDVENQQSMVSD